MLYLSSVLPLSPCCAADACSCRSQIPAPTNLKMPAGFWSSRRMPSVADSSGVFSLLAFREKRALTLRHRTRITTLTQWRDRGVLACLLLACLNRDQQRFGLVLRDNVAFPYYLLADPLQEGPDILSPSLPLSLRPARALSLSLSRILSNACRFAAGLSANVGRRRWKV